jgi:hypothetical protein
MALRWLPMLGLAGCIVRNPAYDEDAGGEASGGGGEASSSSSGLGVTTGDEPTSGVGMTDGAATTGDATTGAIDPTTGDATTATTGTTGADATTDGCAVSDVCFSLSSRTGETYLRCEELVTWAEAEARCEAMCMQMVVFPLGVNPAQNDESAALTTDLQGLMTELDKQTAAMIEMGTLPLGQPRALWWIGGRRLDNNVWTWVDGAVMPPNSTFGWAPTDPEPLPNLDQDCAVLAVYGAGVYDRRWFDRSCNATHRYLCR